LVPGWGGTQRLPRLIGASRALDLILTGRTLNGRQALKLGLVDVVAPAEGLDRAAFLEARRLADGGRPGRPRWGLLDRWARAPAASVPHGTAARAEADRRALPRSARRDRSRALRPVPLARRGADPRGRPVRAPAGGRCLAIAGEDLPGHPRGRVERRLRRAA